MVTRLLVCASVAAPGSGTQLRRGRSSYGQLLGGHDLGPLGGARFAVRWPSGWYAPETCSSMTMTPVTRQQQPVAVEHGQRPAAVLRHRAAPPAHGDGRTHLALHRPLHAERCGVLLRQELCTCDLAATLGVSESATSQHLRLLKALRLVKSRRAGKVVYHSLDDEHIAALIRVGLVHLGHTSEATRLDAEVAESRGA